MPEREPVPGSVEAKALSRGSPVAGRFVGRALLAAAIGAVVAALAWAAASHADRWWADPSETSRTEVLRGRIVLPEGEAPGSSRAAVRMLEGPHAGRVVAMHIPSSHRWATSDGRTCLLRLVTDPEGEASATLLGPVREGRLAVLLGATAAVVALFLGRAGLRALGSLALGGLLIAGVLLPLAVHGWPPLVCAAAIAIVVCVGGLFLIGGANRKSASAVLGCTAAVLLAAALPVLGSRLFSLTGLGVGFGRYFHLHVGLWYSRELAQVDFGDLLVAGMVLGGLGAAMDVAMSVSAAVHAVAPGAANRRRLFGIGLGVGRDILGMMAITVALVAVGAQFEMLFLAYLGRFPEAVLRAADEEEVVAEVLRIAGSVLALGMAVPLTAGIAALWRRRLAHGG